LLGQLRLQSAIACGHFSRQLCARGGESKEAEEGATRSDFYHAESFRWQPDNGRMLAAAAPCCQTELFLKINVLLKKSQIWREIRH
jgi:hypothetical protein